MERKLKEKNGINDKKAEYALIMKKKLNEKMK